MPGIETKSILRYTFDGCPCGISWIERGTDMATAKTQKKTAAKKSVVKTAARKTVAKKTAGMKEGSRYVCSDCGLAVTIDTACGCPTTAHLVCCERPMKLKR
jgi:hypothetical protein